MIEITSEPIDAGKITQAVGHAEDGAIVTFLGVVRDHDSGRSVRYLEYEAYSEMAVALMKGIATEISDRWSITHVAMVHRIGRLEIGDIAVAIAVGSPHRLEAFEACHYAIDRVKETVPIWKKEFYHDGAEWKDR